MIRSLLLSTALVLAITPANAGSILDAMEPPADALKVEFVSPDTTPTDRLAASKPLTVGVVVSRSTGVVQVTPTATPGWMTYDPKTGQFSGVPVAGQHELAVSVTDAGTGQQANGVLSFDVQAR
ncbi:putative Ig domain-containing protein [Agrobacterium salinitolerans]|uniref:Ig domain-containing protein n=1 Tax=Agrobacterium salinitolerans TaxID=1183413 RepID=A0A4Z1R727_9HYPH|nr:putative Ig domain-containing protein [Agrobacterium salinitolerans]UYZ07417.1 putative Ig domain-containing protein [Agrobacterium salinitolerans]